jgi:hypothetical protein
VGRIGRESPEVLERTVETGQHRVQRAGKAVNLVGRSAQRDSLAQVFGGDPPRRLGHLVHGAERRSRNQGPTEGGQTERQRNEHQEDLPVPRQSAFDAFEGHTNLQELGESAVLEDRQSQQPHPLSRRQLYRLERGLPTGRTIARRGRHGQDVTQSGRAGAGRSLRVCNLEELIVELRAQDHADGGFGVGGRRRRRSGIAGVAHHAGDRRERRVHVADEVPPQQRVGQRADHHEDREENPRVPGSEARSNRQRPQTEPHGSAFST